MYEAVCAEDRLPAEGEDEQQQQRRQDELDVLAKRYLPQYLRPYHAAKLVEPRLGMADVTRWTQVITDDKLFVSILSAYLLQEYPVATGQSNMPGVFSAAHTHGRQQ